MLTIELLLDSSEYQWIQREARKSMRGAGPDASVQAYLEQTIGGCYRDSDRYFQRHGKPVPIQPATYRRMVASLDWPESVFVRLIVPVSSEIAALIEDRVRQLQHQLPDEDDLTDRNVVNWDLRRWLTSHAADRGWRAYSLSDARGDAERKLAGTSRQGAGRRNGSAALMRG